ncbi:hypothetical protein [Edwardsiella tarda]|uniref:hypothetical protein n=1 Tax=Edwardsiella tarda TaxID=636 RepID=UPI000FD79F65|nr:hypothetical protein [Edwardsiella tarda]
MKNIAIMILGFNRLESVKRVVNSLLEANYDSNKNIDLVFSIDYSIIQEDIEHYIDSICWNFGKKIKYLHSKNIGMRNNSLFCLRLSKHYDAAIFIEDDSRLSPMYFDYAMDSLDFIHEYNLQNNIFAVSLYSYLYNEFTGTLFFPIVDGYDNYYTQYATTWGFVFTYDMVRDFLSWIERQDVCPSISDGIHPVAVTWPETSWKKYINKYLVYTDKFFFYPRVSLLTNHGDVGVHFKKADSLVQVPIPSNYIRKKYLFSSLSLSLAIYDAYGELSKKVVSVYCKSLSKEIDSVEIDIFGWKTKISHPKAKYFIRLNIANEFMGFPLEAVFFNAESSNNYLVMEDDCSALGYKSEIVTRNEKNRSIKKIVLMFVSCFRKKISSYFITIRR